MVIVWHYVRLSDRTSVVDVQLRVCVLIIFVILMKHTKLWFVVN